MVKPFTFTTHIGGRGGTGDTLDLSGYDADAVVVALVKLDAGAVGQVFAENAILKPYNAPAVFAHDDVPSSIYEWRLSDIGTLIGHENVSGASVALSATTALNTNNEGASRYAGSHCMLVLNQSAVDSNSGHTPLRAAENAGQSWTYETWVFRNNSSALTELLLETNASITSFIQIALNTNGTISVNRTNGGGSWTSPVGTPLVLGAWSHIMVVYNSAGTQQLFINGVSAGAATASTRGAAYTVASPQTYHNRLANSQIYLTQTYLYQNIAMNADDAQRHYNELATDSYIAAFVSTTANIAQNGGVIVLFTNQSVPGFNTGAYSLVMPLTPFIAVGTAGGVFLAEVTSYRSD